MGRKRIKGITVDSPSTAKHVLVAILGTAPAVLTEAIWALVMKENVVPSKIVVLTTTEGRKRYFEDIDKAGLWKSLCADLAAAGKAVGNMRIGENSFVTFPDENENFAKDLLSYNANMRAANTMLETLQKYSKGEDEYVIHGLIAGGRKTMTALFFSCMCLLARKEDKIYHVLVSKGYENPTLSPLFCYPQKGKTHTGAVLVRSGNHWRVKKVALKSELADVNLFSVPFVRMGRWADQMCLDIGRGLTYENLIHAVEKSFDDALSPRVEVDMHGDGRLTIADKVVDLKPSEFAFFLCKMQQKTDDDVIAILKDLQEFMEDLDEANERELKSSKCKWLRAFKRSGAFGRLDKKDMAEQRKAIKSDCGHIKGRTKDKLEKVLPEPVLRQTVVSPRLWKVDYGKLVLKNLEELPLAFRARLFPDGIPTA